MKRIPNPEGEDNDGGGLSPAAWSVFVSPDMIGLWRLRKSLALDDARWYFNAGRKLEAAQMVTAARGSHREILNIVRFLRSGVRPKESLRFAQVFRLDGPAIPGPKPAVRPAPEPHPIFVRTPAAAVVPPAIAKPVADAKPVKLTAREMQIALLLGQDLRVGKIAEQLNTTIGNVSVHISSARKKLGVADRHELGAWARTQSVGVAA
jgi:DNA-binding CsgD family transcriptional regulator